MTEEEIALIKKVKMETFTYIFIQIQRLSIENKDDRLLYETKLLNLLMQIEQGILKDE
jgi:hypothetical protein